MGKTRKITRRKLQSLIGDIAARPDRDDVASRLEDMGIRSTRDVAASFREISRRLQGGGESEEQLVTLLADLLTSPDPGGAVVNFVRFLENAGATGAFFSTVTAGKPLREILATIFGTSQYMADIIIRNPGYLYWLMEKQNWEREETTENYSADLEADVSNFHTVESKLDAARRFQRRMLLKTGVKDLLGLSGVEETTARLSHLADAIGAGVLEILWRDAAPAPSQARPEGFSVLALGKLGGEELNYSSDIDLIYLCEDTDDETIEFYHKLARRLTAALSEATGEGYLYRVDLRLRPDGAAGPLVNPLTAMRLYYERRGRPWEFQAMLKARVVAGSEALGNDLLDKVSRLAFSPTLSYSPVEAIALMRRRIRDSISTRDRSFNIKLMEGGIRDIEFIVQTLQLMYGGRYPDLRVSNTLEGIRRASEKKLIKKLERDTLVNAYCFFRLVEHRLQMMHQLKTHSIPESRDEIELLAKRVSRGPMGSFSYTKFQSGLTSHLNKIRVLSDSFFEGEDVPESALLLLLAEDDELVEPILVRFGIEDHRKALRILQSLAYGSFPDLVERKSRESFQRILQPVLDEFSRSGDPDRALLAFSKLATASRSLGSFYDFLGGSPAIRTLICKLTAMSTPLTNRLCRNIEILDTLMEDPRQLADAAMDVRAAADFTAGTARPETVQTLQSDLRRLLDQRVVASWMLDLENESLPDAMCRTLTRTVRDQVVGIFNAIESDPTGVALFAMGSFAVGEPKLSSDVDLLVVTKDRNMEKTTRQFHRLNEVFSGAGLPKLDFRLRGEGANAPLVQDIAQYETYFKTRMSPWEKIAFAKCLYWGGDEALAGEFVAALSPHLIARPGADEVDTLMATRAKVSGLVPKGLDLLDTKRSIGARYDIEYLCAVGLAIVGETYALGLSTPARLERLEASGVISKKQLDAMRKALETYMLVDYLLDLQGFTAPASVAQEEAHITYLDRTFGLLEVQLDGGFAAVMNRHKKAVRSAYEAVMKRR